MKKTKEFAPRLKEALDSGGVWIFDVEVDYSENLKLTQKLGENVCKC